MKNNPYNYSKGGSGKANVGKSVNSSSVATHKLQHADYSAVCSPATNKVSGNAQLKGASKGKVKY